MRAILQSTLNHQSQVKYSCWNKVPAHSRHHSRPQTDHQSLTVGTEEAELGQLLSSLVQTHVEGLALSLRVRIVTPRHLASAAEQGRRNPGQHRVVSSSNPRHPGHLCPHHYQQGRHSCNTEQRATVRLSLILSMTGKTDLLRSSSSDLDIPTQTDQSGQTVIFYSSAVARPLT